MDFSPTKKRSMDYSIERFLFVSIAYRLLMYLSASIAALAPLPAATIA